MKTEKKGGREGEAALQKSIISEEQEYAPIIYVDPLGGANCRDQKSFHGLGMKSGEFKILPRADIAVLDCVAWGCAKARLLHHPQRLPVREAGAVLEAPWHQESAHAQELSDSTVITTHLRRRETLVTFLLVALQLPFPQPMLVQRTPRAWNKKAYLGPGTGKYIHRCSKLRAGISQASHIQPKATSPLDATSVLFLHNICDHKRRFWRFTSGFVRRQDISLTIQLDSTYVCCFVFTFPCTHTTAPFFQPGSAWGAEPSTLPALGASLQLSTEVTRSRTGPRR